MEVEARATAILRDAEAKLRQLTAEAASVGDYAAIIKVAGWAKTVTDLVRSAEPGSRPMPANAPRIVGPNRTSSEAARRAKVARSEQTVYPRFVRKGDQLNRVAWSKREKKEYQHKASHAVLKALTVVLAEAGKDGRVFSTDELLPIRDLQDGAEIPNYQTYVCIAWLKQIGLIDQHGRQGYSIPRLDEFQNAVESVWRTLPQR
jgi:hypothetical protein